MMYRLTISALLFFSYFPFGFSQLISADPPDSLYNLIREGYDTSPSAFRHIPNRRITRGYEVREKGYYVNDLKEGVWTIWLENGRLLGTRHYEKGHLRRECSLNKGRLIAERYYEEHSGVEGDPYFIYRVIFYDRKGRVKSDERFGKEES